MDEVSTLIYDYFANEATFTAEMGTRIYPLVAREETEWPFAIYTIGNPEAFTKEAVNYPVTLNLYYEKANYTEAVTFHADVKALIDTDTAWNIGDSSVYFLEDDQSIVAAINFEIIY